MKNIARYAQVLLLIMGFCIVAPVFADTESDAKDFSAMVNQDEAVC